MEHCRPSCHAHGERHTLSIQSLSTRYGNVCALQDINFSISCGHSLALVGPNGAGKSTLIKAIANLIPLHRGKILWNSQLNTQCKKGEFAYLPQQESISWHFPISVRGVVEMGRYSQLGWWKTFGKKDHYAVDEALELMELRGDLEKRHIAELSGGQKQRAFLARAIAQQAHVLLLDEPFTGLDKHHSAVLGEFLGRLPKDNRLIIASHHAIETIPSLFDTVLLLNKKMIAYGKVSEVLTPQIIETTFSLS